jgi:hypothetical protein
MTTGTSAPSRVDQLSDSEVAKCYSCPRGLDGGNDIRGPMSLGTRWDELRDRMAVPGDGDGFARLDVLEELSQVCFGFVRSDFSHPFRLV